MSSSKSLNFEAAEEGARFAHIVTEEEAGERLDRVLARQEAIVSREMARRLILAGQVTRNGGPCEPADTTRLGEEIAWHVPPPEPLELRPDPQPLDILHEDPWVIVLNKPPGITMHPGPGNRNTTLVNRLLAHCTDLSGVGGKIRPGIVHRLDKDTSGIVVVAKNDEAHLHLADQFRHRTIHRLYQAIVVGRPPNSKGTVSAPIGRTGGNPFVRRVAEDGKHATTHWKVLRRLGLFTLLQLKLETGRTHQIRVHMAHLDWPVLGDRQYGKGRHRGLALEADVMAMLDLLNRQMLHACALGFTHPHHGEPLSFTAPPPPDMAALLEDLERLA